jgi:hypothetical protein
MSNWIAYQLDVLARNPAEMNQIAERLKQPSEKLVSWVAEGDYVWNAVAPMFNPEEWKLHASSPAEFDRLIKQREEEAAREFASNRSEKRALEDTEAIRELVAFKPDPKLGRVHESVNKARGFWNSSEERRSSVIGSHLLEISAEFPAAIFLLFWCSESRELGKVVMRAGNPPSGFVLPRYQTAQHLSLAFTHENERRTYAE